MPATQLTPYAELPFVRPAIDEAVLADPRSPAEQLAGRFALLDRAELEAPELPPLTERQKAVRSAYEQAFGFVHPPPPTEPDRFWMWVAVASACYGGGKVPSDPAELVSNRLSFAQRARDTLGRYTPQCVVRRQLARLWNEYVQAIEAHLAPAPVA